MIAILETIRISIADLIGGTRGVSSGEPWAHLDVKKIVLILSHRPLRLTHAIVRHRRRGRGLVVRTGGTPQYLLWKNMLKFENFSKCTPEMYLFRFLNTPLVGGRQHRRLHREPVIVSSWCRVTVSARSAVGPSQWLVRCPGTHYRTVSASRRVMTTFQTTVSDIHWKHFILPSAVEVFTTALYKSTFTYLLTYKYPRAATECTLSFL